MAYKPIIFSAPMVRALRAGTKTQTRRVLKPQPEYRGGYGGEHEAESWGWEGDCGDHISVLDIAPNRFRKGDRLWVRETWAPSSNNRGPIYRADGESLIAWRSPIHMPRATSRLTLTVIDVRVQRVQEISEADAVAEGVDAVTMDDVPRQATMSRRADFAAIWDAIHGPDAWDANPWVAALTFAVEARNIDAGNEA